MLYSSIVCAHLSLQPHSSPLLRPSMLTYRLLSSIPAIFSNFHASVPLTASSSLCSLLFFSLFASPPSLIPPYPFICHHPFRNSPVISYPSIIRPPSICPSLPTSIHRFQPSISVASFSVNLSTFYNPPSSTIPSSRPPVSHLIFCIAQSHNATLNCFSVTGFSSPSSAEMDLSPETGHCRPPCRLLTAFPKNRYLHPCIRPTIFPSGAPSLSMSPSPSSSIHPPSQPSIFAPSLSGHTCIPPSHHSLHRSIPIQSTSPSSSLSSFPSHQILFLNFSCLTMNCQHDRGHGVYLSPRPFKPPV